MWSRRACGLLRARRNSWVPLASAVGMNAFICVGETLCPLPRAWGMAPGIPAEVIPQMSSVAGLRAAPWAPGGP